MDIIFNWNIVLISLAITTSSHSSQLMEPKDTSSLYCRDSWIHNITYTRFKTFTCAKCFVQVFFDRKPLILNLSQYPYLLGNVNISYIPNATENSEVCQKYLVDDECSKWRSCCEAAQRCCIEVTSQTQNTQVCPATWDGVRCWSDGSPGDSDEQLCPHYFMAPEVKWLKPKASRECDPNGTWHTHPEHGTEISIYTQCFDQTTNEKILQISIYIDIAGKSVSILLLLAAVILLVTIRPLRRELARNSNLKIHLNLFIAMLFHNIFTIIMDVLYLNRIGSETPVYKKNAVWCRVINTLAKYFLSASFMCMFCEGWQLHKRITHVMKIGRVDPLWKYYVISWVVPLVSVTTYVVCRIVINNESCWIDDTLSYLEFIHIVPNLISLACNFVFLIHIQWTLCTSLRTDTVDRRFNVIRQSLRATVSLIPIFGLQCLFIIYRPQWPPYEIIASIIISSQGLLITILYFYNVKDVKTEIKNLFYKCCQSDDISRQPSIISTATKSSRFSTRYSSSMEVIGNNRKKMQRNTNRRQSAPDVTSVNKIVKNRHLKPKYLTCHNINGFQLNKDNSITKAKDSCCNGLTLIDFHPKAAFKIKHSSWNGLPSMYDVKTSAEYNEEQMENGHPRSHSCTQADEKDHLMIAYRSNGFIPDENQLYSSKKLLSSNLTTIPERRSSSGSRLSSDKLQ